MMVYRETVAVAGTCPVVQPVMSKLRRVNVEFRVEAAVGVIGFDPV